MMRARKQKGAALLLVLWASLLLSAILAGALITARDEASMAKFSWETTCLVPWSDGIALCSDPSWRKSLLDLLTRPL